MADEQDKGRFDPSRQDTLIGKEMGFYHCPPRDGTQGAPPRDDFMCHGCAARDEEINARNATIATLKRELADARGHVGLVWQALGRGDTDRDDSECHVEVRRVVDRIKDGLVACYGPTADGLDLAVRVRAALKGRKDGGKFMMRQVEIESPKCDSDHGTCPFLWFNCGYPFCLDSDLPGDEMIPLGPDQETPPVRCPECLARWPGAIRVTVEAVEASHEH